MLQEKREKAIKVKERRRVEKDMSRVRKVQIEFEEELGQAIPDAEVRPEPWGKFF